MKELSINGKATRYDNVVNKLRRFMAQGVDPLITRADVQDFFPELAESEDERIRKELLSVVNDLVLPDEQQSRFVAWLEKQQKPTDLKTKAGNWYVCDMEVMNENAVTAFHRNEIYYCPKDGYLDVGGALFEVGCLDVFRLATEKEIPQPKQGEQKPSEDEDREYACQSSEHYTRRELMIYNLGIADGKRMIEDAIKETEQKPAWSEEDEINLEKAIWYVENPAPMVVKDSMLAEWLKSLKDRVLPQLKQEWNEEDEVMIKVFDSVIRYIVEVLDKDVLERFGTKREELFSWLKSLKNRVQPNPTWNEEDEKLFSLLNTCVCRCITDPYWDYEKRENVSRNIPTFLDKLKNLKPQSQWKPSDEQIDALESAVSSLQSTALESLYQNLTKINNTYDT